MKRVLLYISCTVLTFALGVAISPIRFKADLIACGYMSDGVSGYSVTRFTSSYFVKLWHSSAGYPSAEGADAALQKRAGEAVRVIERAPKLDVEGRKVGERVVALFSSPEHNGQYACVFWTDETILHSLESPSLMHVLEFEKQRMDY